MPTSFTRCDPTARCRAGYAVPIAVRSRARGDRIGGVKLGVVTEAFGDRPLEAVLAWLADAAPAITDLELASGGYAATAHCDRQLLLRDAAARERWRQGIEER